MHDKRDPHEHFIKQRRSLIAISVFLIFYEVADFSIREINILGNKAEIGEPSLALSFFVIVFTYLLWRYYTACREVAGLSIFKNNCQIWAQKQIKKELLIRYKREKGDLFSEVDLIRKNNWSLVFYISERQSLQRSFPRKQTKVIVKYKYILYKLYAIIPTSLNTSLFSEYLLPYLLALLAILEMMDMGIVATILNFMNEAKA